MEGHVSWIIELAVKEGQLETFEQLREEMVAGTQGESGTLGYEWYVSEDGSSVHILEKYADSDAMLVHVNGFLEHWAGRFMGCVRTTRFVVYGDPSPAAREILDGWNATYLAPWGGFSRFA